MKSRKDLLSFVFRKERKSFYFSVLFLFSIFLIPFMSAFIDGDGSPSNPYQISNCVELQNMSSNLTASYILNNNVDCSDTTNWNNGQGFSPVGFNTTFVFKGSFDGQNYTISNLFQNLNSTFGAGGLFGYVNLAGGTVIIKDVGLTNMNVSGFGYMGGIMGISINLVNISNSYSTGNVNSTSGNVGGLVGYLVGNIANSYSTANIISEGNNVGGLVGAIDRPSVIWGLLINSYATGNVTGDEYVGGLTGQNGGNFNYINTYSTGNVNGNANLGGLTGTNSGNIVSSYYDLNTSGQSDTGKGTGKTTTEMYNISTYVNWNITDIEDFENEIWFINTGNDYPKLFYSFVAPIPPIPPSNAEIIISLGIILFIIIFITNLFENRLRGKS